LDQRIVRGRFCVLHKYIEVSIFIENTGVGQLVFPVIPSTLPVRVDEVAVRVGVLRIFVQILHERVGRRAVEVKIVFLDVFAVIALSIGQAKKTLFQYRVLAVPQG
jgi:hypothetical protein